MVDSGAEELGLGDATDEDASDVGVGAGVEEADGVSAMPMSVELDVSKAGVDEARIDERLEDGAFVLDATIENEDEVTVRVMFTP